jgi:hypothetical protein
MATVFVFTVTAVNNPDDDGASLYGYEPISLVEVYAESEAALLRAENWLLSEVAEHREDGVEFAVDRTLRTSEKLPFYVEASNSSTIYRATVFRVEVVVGHSVVISSPDEVGRLVTPEEVK